MIRITTIQLFFHDNKSPSLIARTNYFLSVTLIISLGEVVCVRAARTTGRIRGIAFVKPSSDRYRVETKDRLKKINQLSPRPKTFRRSGWRVKYHQITLYKSKFNPFVRKYQILERVQKADHHIFTDI